MNIHENQSATTAADSSSDGISTADKAKDFPGDLNAVLDEFEKNIPGDSRAVAPVSRKHGTYEYQSTNVIDVDLASGSPQQILDAQIQEMGALARFAFRLWRSGIAREKAKELFGKVLDIQVEAAIFNVELAKDLATSGALVEYLKAKPALAMEIAAVRAEFKANMLDQIFRLRDTVYDLRNARLAALDNGRHSGRYSKEDVKREFEFAMESFRDELNEMEFQFKTTFAEYLTHLVNKIGSAVQMIGEDLQIKRPPR